MVEKSVWSKACLFLNKTTSDSLDLLFCDDFMQIYNLKYPLTFRRRQGKVFEFISNLL